MKQGLSRNQFLVISLTLFAMFFGAGNFIFPPNLGREDHLHDLIRMLQRAARMHRDIDIEAVGQIGRAHV